MKSTEKYNRIRPLKIYEILKRETDESHPMGTKELSEKLKECGIESHRTTIYGDIDLLNECGYEIMCHRGRSNLYYVADRSFNEPELRILMDAVQAASFITDKKTVELVDKIADLAGSKKGQVIKSNVVKFNTNKSTNEDIYYSVNEIIRAIEDKKKIVFYYFDYDNNHRRIYRNPQNRSEISYVPVKRFALSPFATVLADGNYYVLTYYPKYKKISHYRIDRMEKVTVIDDDADMPPCEITFDVATYKKQLFGMFAGETTKVHIEVDKSLRNAIFDLFGEHVNIFEHSENTVRLKADVQVCPLFFGWCSSFGDKLKLLGPDNIVAEFNEYLKVINGIYANDKEEKDE